AMPWRLHLPRFKGVVKIDGVTRWDKGDAFEDLSLWTPEGHSWFAFHEYRWLLTPYTRLVYLQEGASDSVEFQVHNNGLLEKKVALSVEFPGGSSWPVALSLDDVVLAPGKTAKATLSFKAPPEGDTRVCLLRATPLDGTGISTYSTLDVRQGIAPAAAPLPIPLVLNPYQHENAQFGYAPKYPLDNQVYFDMHNRPVIAAGSALRLWRHEAWRDIGRVQQEEGRTAPVDVAISKVAFDQDNVLYTLGDVGGTKMLLHLESGADVFAGTQIPGARSYDIEQFSGHNCPEGPPPFVSFRRTEKDPKLRWRSLNDLELFVPTKDEERNVTIGEPILLSEQSLGCSMHSGIPSSVVSRGRKVHVAWAEATDPDDKVPGVPTFVATYDRDTAATTERALVGYGPPPNDVHNTPCITMDGKGYLHVLVGTHGSTFKYAKSLEPNNAAGGWTEAKDIGPGLRQTYIGMVCDQDDTLHVVFRLWRTDDAYFPDATYATLAHMSKPADGAWSE
ncbi:MAG TPA: hypothetical protein ENN80_00620, partial [Candidatus Hydrogenedentes bacterium]|nr:hypothetical protein [Candidatus Hydrogenedentota bacterium]